MRSFPSHDPVPGVFRFLLLILTSWSVHTMVSAQPGTPSAMQEAITRADAAARSDMEAIPRFEEAHSESVPATGFEVPGVRTESLESAVEIPAELVTEPASSAMEEKIEVEAEVEEEVDDNESTVKKIQDAPAMHAPVSAEDLRSRSAPNRDGQVGSSVLTRTEARTFTFTIPAPRGQLLDRQGYPLAQNQVAHYPAITFPFLGTDVKDEEIIQYAGQRIQHVRNLLGTEWDVNFKTVVHHYRHRRWFPLTFGTVLSKEEITELERQSMEGLTMHPVYLRHYPQGATLSHVLGFVGKRPPRATGEIVSDEPLWGEGFGVDGLEEAFETDLRGTPGRINVVFEADGTKIKEDVLRRPKPGHNIITSIDLEMQQICEDILQEKVKRGAMVVMDVHNGDVLAMASFPQYNPNDFIPSISQEAYSALANDPEKPLFPRAFRATYPPASTFKIPVALGFLESGYISGSDLYPCPSSWRVGNLVMRNWNAKGEGAMNVIGAITRSCNTWFYEVAIHAGGDSMSNMAVRLGLGQKTGIPLKEADGFIPTNRWFLDQYGHMMSDGDEAVMSIGQGKVEVTPLQVARMMAALGNGKHVPSPRLVTQVQDANHEIERTFPIDTANQLNLDPHSLEIVKRGMYDVVNAGNGTAKGAYHKITVSGKTGTGQWKPAQKQNIAWFAGYFPSKYPVYSFAVIYEGDPGEGVSGGRQAAPVVGEFLKRYLTEDNYNAVRERSNSLKEEFGDDDQYTFREPVQSIYRSSAEESTLQEVVPTEQTAQPRPRGGGGGGLLERLFGRRP